jgi:nitrogen fixation-related uncharacterized protein
MIIGISISAVVFAWALKNDQFSDQKRARFLPLEDEPGMPPVKISKINRFEAYALWAIASLGLIITAAVLAVTLLKWG